MSSLFNENALGSFLLTRLLLYSFGFLIKKLIDYGVKMIAEVNSSSAVYPTAPHNRPSTRCDWHRFIPSLFHVAGRCWERFKAIFYKQSSDTLFIKGLLACGNVPWKTNQRRLADLLISTTPHSCQGHLLKGLLKKCGKEDLKAIFHLAFEKAYNGSTVEPERFADFLDSDKIISLSGAENVFPTLEELALCLPETKPEKKEKVGSEMRKTLRVVLRFFPNFMDTVLKAFNLIEAGKGPETMWDFSAMVEIYFKIFMIPHSVFMILGAVVSVPWQVMLITFAIILASIVGVCLYLKYRPCPNKLSRARNLSEEAALGKFDPFIGRESEIQKIGSYLGKKTDDIRANLILVGEPGVGKTAIVKKVAEQNKEKKIFALNAPELASGYTPIGDKLTSIFIDIRGHEDEVVFFIDELGEAIKKNSMVNIGGYLKPLIEKDGIQVIAAVTTEEYKDLIVPDKALASRFQKIDINPPSKEQTLKILQERIKRKGTGIWFAKGIEEEIYQRTNEAAQPRQSVNLLDLAINRVKAFDINKYISAATLLETEKLYHNQQIYSDALCNGGQTSDIAKDIIALKANIEILRDDDERSKSLAFKTRRLMQEEQRLTLARYMMAQKGKSHNKLPFLQGILLPWITQAIQENLKKIPEEIPMQVESNLISCLSD